MSEWWTYRLSSFVLFSPRTYVRLIEHYNADVWPLQLVAMAAAIAIVLEARSQRSSASRAIALVLAATWLFVAWAFHIRRYASINWAAHYFAIAFAAQAVLLAWIGTVRGRLRFTAGASLQQRAGYVIVIAALAGMPVAEWLAGRGWRELEWFGIAPDPTVVGTLGVLLLARERPPWSLLVIPLSWCAVNGAFQWALGLADALALPLSALLVLATRFAPRAPRAPRPSAR
jgi:hypothetical protein